MRANLREWLDIKYQKYCSCQCPANIEDEGLTDEEVSQIRNEWCNRCLIGNFIDIITE
jgi:hypothetical protein